VPRKAGAKLQQFNQTAKFFANFFTFYALLFHFHHEKSPTVFLIQGSGAMDPIVL
jgi:hypothetical protein